MDNELTDKIAELQGLDALRGGEALKTYEYRNQLRRQLTPMLIAALAERDAEIKRLNADLTDALNSRDHFGTLWDALREDLEDERAGRPLLAKATDRIAQLENDLTAAQSEAPRVIIPGEMIDYGGEVWIPAKKHEQVCDKYETEMEEK